MDIRIRTTKAAVRDALINIMAEKTFESVTISALCEEANISRKTFYMHYNDITAVVQDIGDEFYNQFCEMFTSYKNGDYQIRYIIRDINIILMNRKSQFYKMAVSPSHHEFHKVLEEAFMKIVDQVLKTTYRITSKNTPYYSCFYASGLISLYGNWFRNNTSQSIEELNRIINRCCFMGADQFIAESQKEMNPDLQNQE